MPPSWMIQEVGSLKPAVTRNFKGKMLLRVTKYDTSSRLASSLLRERLPELPKKLWRCALKLKDAKHMRQFLCLRHLAFRKQISGDQ